MALVQAVANDNGASAGTIACTISSSTAGSCLTAIVGRQAKLITGVTDNYIRVKGATNPSTISSGSIYVTVLYTVE